MLRLSSPAMDMGEAVERQAFAVFVVEGRLTLEK